jgi:hypothetical protein
MCAIDSWPRYDSIAVPITLRVHPGADLWLLQYHSVNGGRVEACIAIRVELAAIILRGSNIDQFVHLSAFYKENPRLMKSETYFRFYGAPKTTRLKYFDQWSNCND